MALGHVILVASEAAPGLLSSFRSSAGSMLIEVDADELMVGTNQLGQLLG